METDGGWEWHVSPKAEAEVENEEMRSLKNDY